MYLPRFVNLIIKYESLMTITKNFTNGVTHFTIGKLKSIDVCQSFVRPENFPLLLNMSQNVGKGG
jgi:hypothetical protein